LEKNWGFIISFLTISSLILSIIFNFFFFLALDIEFITVISIQEHLTE